MIKAGETSANVYLWAGQLAEQARAESLYRQASDLSGPEGRLAVLHLARLYHRIQQIQRASQLLSAYLAKYPDDHPARTLLAVITQKNASGDPEYSAN